MTSPVISPSYSAFGSATGVSYPRWPGCGGTSRPNGWRWGWPAWTGATPPKPGGGPWREPGGPADAYAWLAAAAVWGPILLGWHLPVHQRQLASATAVGLLWPGSWCWTCASLAWLTPSFPGRSKRTRHEAPRMNRRFRPPPEAIAIIEAARLDLERASALVPPTPLDSQGALAE